MAVPDGKTPGTGLTILVGPNNSGKTTFIEALTACTQAEQHRFIFTENQRNRRCNDVSIKIATSEGESREIKSTRRGGSYAERSTPTWPTYTDVYTLPSRRLLGQPYMANSINTFDYRANFQRLAAARSPRENFIGRIMDIIADQQEYDRFNALLRQICPYFPPWTVEVSDNGFVQLGLRSKQGTHSGDGIGEGLINVLFLADALHSSHPGSIVAIDEPEVSLHPALQRNLMRVISHKSADRQILIATHSPILVDWSCIVSGAAIARLTSADDTCEVNPLSDKSRRQIGALSKDRGFPHLFGLNASEVFFLDDNILITEGQDDVVCYPKIFDQIGIKPEATLYGWGAGGAGNIKHLALILKDLGFRRVGAVLDRKDQAKLTELRQEFPDYKFEVIPADDVRTKKSEKARAPVEGLLDEEWIVRASLVESTKRIMTQMSDYFIKGKT